MQESQPICQLPITLYHQRVNLMWKEQGSGPAASSFMAEEETLSILGPCDRHDWNKEARYSANC